MQAVFYRRPRLAREFLRSFMNELLQLIETIPVVDCHEHQALGSNSPDPRYPGMHYVFPHEPIAYLLRGYFSDDLISAGASEEDLAFLKNSEISTKEKWSVFSRLWKRTAHTAYALE